jgi:hypothetical protein
MLFDGEWLRHQYVSLRRTTPDIGRELNCAPGTVLRWMIHHGIESRSRGSEKGHTRVNEAARKKMSEAKRFAFIGSANPNWKGGITTRDLDRGRYPAKVWVKAVKDRDGWVCTQCGSTDRLHAHHIQRWKDQPDLRYEVSNGITLCHECHDVAHGKGFKYQSWHRKAEMPKSASALSQEGKI